MTRNIEALAADVRARISEVLAGTTSSEFREERIGEALWQFNVSSTTPDSTQWSMMVMGYTEPFEFSVATGAGLDLELDDSDLDLAFAVVDAVVHGRYRRVAGIFGDAHEISEGSEWTLLPGRRRPRWVQETKTYGAYR